MKDRLSNIVLASPLLILMLMLSACAPKSAQLKPEDQAPRPIIESVVADSSDGRSTLTISTSAPMMGNYTVVNMTAPPRMIIDIQAEPGRFAGTLDVYDGSVGRVITSKLDSGGSRFEVLLVSESEYLANVNGNVLEISFMKIDTTASESLTAEAGEAGGEVSEDSIDASAGMTHTPLSVVGIQIKKAGKLTVAEIITNGEPADYKAMVLTAPNRLIVDIGDAKDILTEREYSVVSPHIKGATLNMSDGHVQTVFEFMDFEMPYEIEKGQDRIVIYFGWKAEDSAEDIESSIVASGHRITVKDVKVRKAGKYTIADIITSEAPSEYNVLTLKAPDRVVVDIINAREIKMKKDLKVSTKHVKGVRLGRYDDKVRVVFDHKGPVKAFDVVKGPDRIVIFFGRKPTRTVAKVEKSVIESKSDEVEKKSDDSDADKSAPLSNEPAVKTDTDLKIVSTKVAESPQVREELTTAVVTESAIVDLKEDKSQDSVQDMKEIDEQAGNEMKVFTGQRVTLEFKDAELKNIFRIISEVSGYNIIIDDDVKGKMTLRLINVPWDQALDLILETNGLTQIEIGNVKRIALRSKIEKETSDKLASKKAMEKLEELVTKLVPVSYAKVGELAGKLKNVMTDRGSVTVDDRTSTVILKDTQKSVDDAEKLIKSLDAPTPQVIIEARIVTANTNFARDLGVQWGTGFSADAAHGNPTGSYFPNSIGVRGGGGGTFVLNPPATGGVGAGGSGGGVMGISFGSINNTLNLDLRLSALESQGWGKVISSPKISTVDNKEASIQQGISIPFETTSASGTQTTFVDANLNLTVTPHVTADNRIAMKLKVSKNRPDLAFKGASGAPSIDKKEASTEILVADGETTVIGGIYEVDKSEKEFYTPFLGKLPIIGWLFKSKSVTDTKTELLIFITPRISRDNP